MELLMAQGAIGRRLRSGGCALLGLGDDKRNACGQQGKYQGNDDSFKA
jgi:hypothetical protein